MPLMFPPVFFIQWKKDPDYFTCQPRYGYIDLSGGKTKQNGWTMIKVFKKERTQIIEVNSEFLEKYSMRLNFNVKHAH